MVSALRFALALALAWVAPASAQEIADSSATHAQDQEDALETLEGETGLVLEDAARPALPARRTFASAGRLRVAGDALALTGTVAWNRLVLDALLAREPGERRLFDDAHARLSWQPQRGASIALGRVSPDVGAGLVLAPPRTGTRAPGRLVRGEALPPLSATPARAASGFLGLWGSATFGPVRAGALAAWTRRDARRVGDALLPLAGVRHRDARGDSARGALGERIFALALEAGPAWLVLAHARADPHRVPPAGASASVQRTARVVRGGAMLEAGVRTPPARGTFAEAALAFDGRGRTRGAFALEIQPRESRTRATLSFESEAGGFVPLRARPEHLPHAHASVLARGPLGPGSWRFEAHAVERHAFEPVRLWATLRLAPRARGAWLELRRDAAPIRSLLAFRAPAGPHLALLGELRYDRHGLARESWRARAEGPLPAGFTGAVELRLGSARTSLSWIDSEVPGGAWVAAGDAAERTRVELARSGRLSPRIAWLWTRTVAGARSEARMGLEWSTEP